MIALLDRLMDRLALAAAGRVGFRTLQLELQIAELRRDIAVLRSDHDDLKAISRELYIGSPVTGDKA